MYKYTTAVFLALASMLQADSGDVMINGILLIGNENHLVSENLQERQGVNFSDLDLPGSVEELREEFAHLLHKPLTEEMIAQVKKEVFTYYRKHQRPVILVTVPHQEISQGVLQVVVTESKLGSVICKGNEHYSCSTLEKYIRSKPDAPIVTDQLFSDIAFMNRSPFRKTDVVFAPGSKENTTDIVLSTKDRLTWRFYAGGDNTGTRLSGNARWFGGFNWGNVFGWDHTFSYQYTTASALHNFQSHTFYYSAPTRYHHTVVVYGGFSHVHPKLSSLNDDVQPAGGKLHGSGFSSQASGRYYIPAGKIWESYLHEFVLGFDYKHMNNNLEFVTAETIPIVSKSVNLTQFVAGYRFGKETSRNKITFDLDVYGSPGHLVGGGTDQEFNALRNRATNQYIYGRALLQDLFQIKWGVAGLVLIRGQAASEPLLPSEQFGLGGYDTVRGYEEREFYADQAVLGTFELHLPTFSILKWTGMKNGQDRLYFLGFVDYARGWNYKSLSNEKREEWLAGVGPGVRYDIRSNLRVRADWGFKLHKGGVLGHHESKVHVSVIASY